MVHARRLSVFAGLLLLCSAFTLSASADTFTQTGKLGSDNQIVEIPFSTATTQSFTFFTTSYTGGVNANGTLTPGGGFDPVLSLFNADGSLFNGAGTPVSNGGSDADLTDVLGPGSYILALTEFANFSNDGTLAGFTTDNGAFISSVCGTSPAFTDAVDCSQKTANYAVNYTSSAVTPEPPSALLLFLPLVGVAFLNRRRLLSLNQL